MARITIIFKAVKSNESRNAVLKLFKDKKLTLEEWQLLKTEGVIKNVPKSVSNGKDQNQN